ARWIRTGRRGGRSRRRTFSRQLRDWIMGRWLAFVLMLAALSPAAAQDAPVRGGTLVFNVNTGDPPTYDCHQSVLFSIIHLLTPHYSNLLKIDMPNYPKIAGDLAESWTVADDAKTYTFKLHAG